MESYHSFINNIEVCINHLDFDQWRPVAGKNKL